MKAMRYVKFSACFLFFSLFALGLTAWAQSKPATDSEKWSAIDKRLTDSEVREKQILENQTKILDELHKLRVLVRRS